MSTMNFHFDFDWYSIYVKTGLVKDGYIGISDISHQTIKTIHGEYLPHCNKWNFCGNFWDFVAAWDLETKYNGVR